MAGLSHHHEPSRPSCGLRLRLVTWNACCVRAVVVASRASAAGAVLDTREGSSTTPTYMSGRFASLVRELLQLESSPVQSAPDRSWPGSNPQQFPAKSTRGPSPALA